MERSVEQQQEFFRCCCSSRQTLFYWTHQRSFFDQRVKLTTFLNWNRVALIVTKATSPITPQAGRIVDQLKPAFNKYLKLLQYTHPEKKILDS